MPSTIKPRGKKNTYWYLGHWNGREYRFSLRTTVQREAEFKKRQEDAKLSHPSYQVPRRINPTCDEFWDKYEEWMKKHREPATLAVQTIFWNQLLQFTKAKRLGDITQQNIESFKIYRRENGKTPTTINNALKDFQAMFNRAIKEKWFTGTNPVIDVERFVVDEAIPEYHSKEELERLLTVTEQKDIRLHWAVQLASLGGLRKREVAYLKWDVSFDWNPDAPLIKVAKHESFKIKTHQQRNIPMPMRIYDTMAPHVQESGYVFNSNKPSQGKSRYRWDCKKSLESALDEAGLTKEKPFQRLRTTFGSLHIAAGRPYALVAAWMGNSEKVVRRNYQGLMPYDNSINDL